MNARIMLSLLLLQLGGVAFAAVAAPGLDQQDAVRFSQGVVGSTPGEFLFQDREGQAVRLSEFRGKPLLVNFVYTGCFKVCPTSTRALLRAVSAMRDQFGEGQFNVLSIGFNPPTDSPVAMKVFAAQHRIRDGNWQFLSPQLADVPALATAFGFRFMATPGGFDHTVQVSVIDRDGVLQRQVYGEEFTADALGEPIRQMLKGALLEPQPSLTDLFERVRIVCSIYDPLTGRYRTNYTLVLEIAGGLTFVSFMLFFTLGEWWTRRRLRKRSMALPDTVAT